MLTNSTHTAPRPEAWRADIDGLRAIAIGLVVIFHFQLLPIGEAGFIGVDVFFVISGFLITGNIARGLADGSFRLTTFYYRRVRRLYPAMITMLALYLLAGHVLLLPTKFEELGVETLLSQLYVVNIYFWRTISYFGLRADNVPLLHMWSLAVEEQFYLFYPLLLLLIHRFQNARMLLLLGLITVLSFGLGWAASGWKPQAAFYLLPTRAWELIAGGVLVLTLRRHPPPAGLLYLAGPLGLGLIALALVLHTPATAVPGWFIGLPVAASVLLLLAGLAPTSPTARLLSWPGMVWLGQISYPLYLFHWPVIILMRDTLPEVTLAWRLAGLAGSVLLAWLTWRFVETPLRHRRLIPTPRAFVITTLAVVAVMIGATGAVMFTKGVPQRFGPDVLTTLAYARDTPEQFASCVFRPSAPDRFCTLGRQGGPVTSLMFGDSHARALAGAFDIWQAEQGHSTAFGFSSACLPVPGTGRPKCETFTKAAVQKALNTASIKTVYLVSIWRQPYQRGYYFDGQWLSGDAAHAAFVKRLTALVSRLQAAGKQVVLVDPLFAAARNVPDTLAKNIAFGRTWAVDTPLAQHQQDFARLFEAFSKAQALGARRISLIDGLCSGGRCRSVWQGRPVFTDNNHLGLGMMPYFASQLAENAQTGQP